VIDQPPYRELLADQVLDPDLEIVDWLSLRDHSTGVAVAFEEGRVAAAHPPTRSNR